MDLAARLMDSGYDIASLSELREALRECAARVPCDKHLN